MRIRLKKYLGKPLRYVGTVEKLNEKNILLRDITLDGKLMTDHQFINLTKFNAPIVQEGETYSFIGTASSYNRADGTRDYKIKKCHSFRNTSIFRTQKDNEQAKRRRTV